MKGVTDQTLKVLNVIKEYKELNQYYLVGGTGLSIHLDHRLSEDIDLFFYNQYPGKRLGLPNIKKIQDRFKSDFNQLEYTDNEDQHVSLIINGIKVELFSEHRLKRARDYGRIGQIRWPSEQSLLGMKLISLSFRDQWRDIYDLYVLSEKYGETAFYEGFEAIVTSYYLNKADKLKTFRGLIKRKLQDKDYVTKLFGKDPMNGLTPKYKITPNDIVNRFISFGSK